jgi:hypothetical protein
MLSEGRLIPVLPEYFEGSFDADGSGAVWPVQEGLTIEQALRPDSVLMERIRGDQFRRDGRVVLLVLPDSFATFRAFRETLVTEGVDFGWEPLLRTTVGVGGPNARAVESQGPARNGRPE